MTTIDRFDGKHSFLSNFSPARVMLDGVTFATVEHAYQAAKTLDPHERSFIFVALTPGRAKRAGRSLALRRDWEDVKVGIMLDLLRQKFHPGGELAKLLDRTGDAELIEGNWWGDTFWGVCRGKGQNWLGKLLMQVREENRA